MGAGLRCFYPQTHVVWRCLAPVLCGDYTVIATDLRTLCLTSSAHFRPKPAVVQPTPVIVMRTEDDRVGSADVRKRMLVTKSSLLAAGAVRSG